MREATPTLLTTRELAAYLRVTLRTAQALLASRRIPALRRGGNGRWLVKREDAEAFLVSPGEPPQAVTSAEERRQYAEDVKALRAIGYDL